MPPVKYESTRVGGCVCVVALSERFHEKKLMPRDFKRLAGTAERFSGAFVLTAIDGARERKREREKAPGFPAAAREHERVGDGGAAGTKPIA